MRTSFYIKNEKLDECKTFIRNNLNSARFLTNPIFIGNKWNINLELNVEDGNKLNELFNKWNKEEENNKCYK